MPPSGTPSLEMAVLELTIRGLDPAAVALQLGVTVADVEDALRRWEEAAPGKDNGAP